MCASHENFRAQTFYFRTFFQFVLDSITNKTYLKPSRHAYILTPIRWVLYLPLLLQTGVDLWCSPSRELGSMKNKFFFFSSSDCIERKSNDSQQRHVGKGWRWFIGFLDFFCFFKRGSLLDVHHLEWFHLNSCGKYFFYFPIAVF